MTDKQANVVGVIIQAVASVCVVLLYGKACNKKK